MEAERGVGGSSRSKIQGRPAAMHNAPPGLVALDGMDDARQIATPRSDAPNPRNGGPANGDTQLWTGKRGHPALNGRKPGNPSWGRANGDTQL